MVAILTAALVIGAAMAISWPLGRYLRWAMDPDDTALKRRRYEAISRAMLGKGGSRGQNWKQYCLSMLAFNLLMLPRVARARGLPVEILERLVRESTESPSLFLLGGEPLVNVLRLNLALDETDD